MNSVVGVRTRYNDANALNTNFVILLLLRCDPRDRSRLPHQCAIGRHRTRDRHRRCARQHSHLMDACVAATCTKAPTLSASPGEVVGEATTSDPPLTAGDRCGVQSHDGWQLPHLGTPTRSNSSPALISQPPTMVQPPCLLPSLRLLYRPLNVGIQVFNVVDFHHQHHRSTSLCVGHTSLNRPTDNQT